jgi:hypothetical protein
LQELGKIPLKNVMPIQPTLFQAKRQANTKIESRSILAVLHKGIIRAYAAA